MSDPFYVNKLYPLQDTILQSIGSLTTGFYLTGGTALSRIYLEHRFSDDLDFFINNAEDFQAQVETIIGFLKKSAWRFDLGARANDFIRIFLQQDELRLKMDFVNDIEPHFGELLESAIFPRIDSWRNILSNKICALSRQEAKDFADIIFIAGRYPFDWEEIIEEARQKDLWVEPVAISELCHDIPADVFQTIKWTQPVDYQKLHQRIQMIAKDILLGRPNSLQHG